MPYKEGATCGRRVGCLSCPVGSAYLTTAMHGHAVYRTWYSHTAMPTKMLLPSTAQSRFVFNIKQRRSVLRGCWSISPLSVV